MILMAHLVQDSFHHLTARGAAKYSTRVRPRNRRILKFVRRGTPIAALNKVAVAQPRLELTVQLGQPENQDLRAKGPVVP